MRPPFTLGLSVALSLPLVSWFVDASRRERVAVFHGRVEELREIGLLPGTTARDPEVTRLFDELDRAWDALEGLQSADEIATRLGGAQELEDARRLALEVEALGPHIETLGALLALPVARESVSEQRLALNAPRYFTRAWVEGLCSDALVTGRGGDTMRCVLRLEQALDLARLYDDGSISALAARQELERRVVEALQRLLSEGAVDARALVAGVGPRLASSASIECVRAAWRAEIGFLVDRSPLVLEREGTWIEWIVGAQWPDVGVRTLEDILDQDVAMVELASPPCLPAHEAARHLSSAQPHVSELGMRWLGFHATLHTGLRRAELARAALRVYARRARDGSWPPELASVVPCGDPCRRRALVYLHHPGGFELGYGAADLHGSLGEAHALPAADATLHWQHRDRLAAPR